MTNPAREAAERLTSSELQSINWVLDNAEVNRQEALKEWQGDNDNDLPLIAGDRACLLMESWCDYVKDDISVLKRQEIHRWAELAYVFMAKVYTAMVAADCEKKPADPASLLPDTHGYADSLEAAKAACDQDRRERVRRLFQG